MGKRKIQINDNTSYKKAKVNEDNNIKDKLIEIL